MNAEALSDHVGPNRPSVIVAEDEFLIRLSVSEALRDAGFRVLEAASATDAEAVLLAGECPDFLLTDVHMGAGGDGFWLARRCASLCPDVFVVIVSGLIEPADPRARAWRFLSKPYEVRQVVNLFAAEWRKRRP